MAGKTLISEYMIENPDSKPLPFGFGTHPYFRVPLGEGKAADCRVTVPVEHVGTGGPVADRQEDAGRRGRRLAHGMRFETMKLDNVFGGLAFDNHRCTPTFTTRPAATR